MSTLTKRQEEIVWSAISLIDEKGIQGLTIKNLAVRMKFTEAAIYRHFKSKANILTAIIVLFKAQTTQIINEKERSSENSLTQLKNIFLRYSNIFSKNPAIVSVIFAEEIFQNEASLTARLTEIIETNEQYFSRLIQQGQKAGEIRNDIDPTLAATNLLGSFRLTVKKWKLNGFAYSLQDETKRLTAYFTTILQPV
ncbi:MAG: TetR/AcrR family transcriptional regulator [Bacteroidota bacterium]